MLVMKKKILKSLAAILFLVPFILICAREAFPEEDAESYYDKGTDLLRQGDLAEAISNFDLAINIIKQNGISDEEKEPLAEAYNNRGLAYYDLGNYLDAEQDFFNAKDYNSEDIKILNNLALTYYVQNYFTLAMGYYEEALDLIMEEEPIHADIYNNLGVCYANQDPPDLTKAMTAYNNSIRISKEAEWGDDVKLAVEDTSNYTEAYYNRGNLYYNENSFDAAINDYNFTITFYEGALSTESDVLENAYYNRGLCYYNKGLYSDAINDYEKVIELNPSYMWAYYAKGFAHYMIYQDAEAIAEYQMVLDSGGSEVYPYALFGMGLVKMRKQDTFDQGMEYLQQSCDSGNCTIACEALEQGLFASPGTILDFELPL